MSPEWRRPLRLRRAKVWPSGPEHPGVVHTMTGAEADQATDRRVWPFFEGSGSPPRDGYCTSTDIRHVWGFPAAEKNKVDRLAPRTGMRSAPAPRCVCYPFPSAWRRPAWRIDAGAKLRRASALVFLVLNRRPPPAWWSQPALRSRCLARCLVTSLDMSKGFRTTNIGRSACTRRSALALGIASQRKQCRRHACVSFRLATRWAHLHPARIS